ncbi:MAG: tRNA preQ1(34) S-adenosylmethionine ribosyltransferase-isomerase QueA [Myxococcota bacterium]
MQRPTPQSDLRVDDFDFELPAERIAQIPPTRREDARLMLVSRAQAGEPGDARIDDLPDLVRGDELIVLNDTRVVPARLVGQKPTGGRVELLVLEADRDYPRRVIAMGRASKPLRSGTPVHLPGYVEATVETVLGEGLYRVRLPGADDLWGFLERHGEVPLPPYIQREDGPTDGDVERYQTVFADEPGSVAAPTAGLHFTDGILGALRARGCEVARLTLHVGPGTFLPVRTERLADHRMHSERFSVPEETASALERARTEGRPVLAVGTTVVRTLEAVAAREGRVVPCEDATDIFIRPGWRFRVVDQLMTNFHLPRSTLLMLVSAFCGRERILAAYREAVRRGYRFFSYGDGMLIR